MSVLTSARRRSLRWSIIPLAAVALSAAVCGPAEQEAEVGANVATVAAETETPTPATSVTAEPSRTATAISTAVPQPTSTTIVVEFPTPSGATDTMVLGGSLWVDAQRAEGEVLAYVNGNLCGRSRSVRTSPDSDAVQFAIEIASEFDAAGCGRPGDPVTLSVNGRAMNDTIPWQPGYQQRVTLISGPPFALLSGQLLLDGIPPALDVIAYVDDQVCGQDSVTKTRPDSGLYYVVVVSPAELVAGCGAPGASVTLVVRSDGQQDVVLETLPWQVDFLSRPTVDLNGEIVPLPTAGGAE